MLTARDLLEFPIYYDIIISDFGRDATIEYLRLVAYKEKELLTKILSNQNLEFFDEYRRIMFTTIGDVVFFKETAISNIASERGHITEDILIGVGANPGMTQEFIDRVALTVIQEALSAIDRGHRNLRVMIPCNTLSNLAKQIGRIIDSPIEIERILRTYTIETHDTMRITNAKICIHTVPESVVAYIATAHESVDNSNEKINLLVLGTDGTNKIYNSLEKKYPINILTLSNSEQKLIDRAVVASIGGKQQEIVSSRELLQREIIQPRKAKFNNLIVLEACTDFHFGVGVSSLEVFADAMVNDCYRFGNP